MDDSINGKRERFWDIAKGITILLVILGHTENVNTVIAGAVYSFHMPLFFIANAYFIKDYNIQRHLKRSSRSLLVPYSVICIISAVCCVNQNVSDVQNHIVFFKRILDMFVGMSKISTMFTSFESVWLVWFVICLFAARIIYVLLMGILQKFSAAVSLIVMLVLSMAGMLIGVYYAYLPWSLDVSLVALPLMWFGDYLHKSALLKKLKLNIYIILFFIWVVFGIFGFRIEMSMREYPGYILVLVEAIAGSMVLIGSSVFIGNKFNILSSFLMWCGRNSIVILAVHCLEMRFYDWNINIFSKIPFSLNYICIFLIKTIIILAISWIIIKINNFKRYLDDYEVANAN